MGLSNFSRAYAIDGKPGEGERPKLPQFCAADYSGTRSQQVYVLSLVVGKSFPCTYLTLVLVQMMYSISSE